MRLCFSLLACVILAGVNGCRETPEPTAATKEGVRIVALRFRDGFIDIRTGQEGRSFSIRDREGGIIAAELSADDLQARFPSHFEALQRGLAAPLDASLHGRLSERDQEGGRPIYADLDGPR